MTLKNKYGVKGVYGHFTNLPTAFFSFIIQLVECKKASEFYMPNVY